ncbi:hypothetical protein RE628_24465 [Paenibacillus sp. D2_2]|uniref:hypothetical protein n=1 Tax=Paenibacillus sp. D2_2 TaxID=3073092 RepID=UPI002815AD75|nr:hypothetical protein [Paenibacillus sp. D2_2]WMT40333.1 hypothetical protein RE628_24465 [Paenibacillus sp. D2_2]
MKTDSLPIWVWLLVFLALFTQGLFMFLDARRRGRRAWLWGLWGLMNFPLPVVVYSIAVIWLDRRRGRSSGDK